MKEREADGHIGYARAPSVTVRRATIADLERIMEIEVTAYSAPWHTQTMRSELEADPDRKVYLVAEVDGWMAGYIGSHVFAGEVHIATVAVAPRYQRMGLGELLVLTMLAYAVEHGCDYVTLEYRISNRAAEQLYQKVGFIPVRVRTSYYIDNGEDAIVAEITNIRGSRYRKKLERLIERWGLRHEYDVHVII